MSFKIYVVASVVNASSYNLFDSPGITRGMIEGVHFSVCVCVSLSLSRTLSAAGSHELKTCRI